MFGRNDFLGEITLPLAGRIFDDPTPHWYQLQERVRPSSAFRAHLLHVNRFDCLQSELLDDSSHLPLHRGDIIVALKYVPSDPMNAKKTKKSKTTNSAEGEAVVRLKAPKKKSSVEEASAETYLKIQQEEEI